MALDRSDLDAARRHLELALQIAIDTDLEPIIDARLARFARLAAALGRSEDAVRLLGYARMCVDTGSLRRPPQNKIEQCELEANLAKQGRLPYDRLWRQGYYGSRAQAIAIALGDR